MQRTSGQKSTHNILRTPIRDVLPPPGAAPRVTVQQPLSARAQDQPVEHEDQVGPEDELRAHRRANCFEQIERLTGVIAHTDEYLASGHTGSTEDLAAEQVSALRAKSAVDLLYWQNSLKALDAPEARDVAVHEHKDPSAAPGLSDQDGDQIAAAKAQGKLAKKMRQQALRQPLVAPGRVKEEKVPAPDPRSRAVCNPARPARPEQKDPSPAHQGMVSASKAVVVHAAEVKSEKPAPAQVEKSEQHEPTPLERLQRFESGQPDVATALVDFIVTTMAKKSKKKRVLAEIKDWPGYTLLDHPCKKLAGLYGELAEEDRAKTQVYWAVFSRQLQPLDGKGSVRKEAPRLTKAVELLNQLSHIGGEVHDLRKKDVKLNQALVGLNAVMATEDTDVVVRFMDANQLDKIPSLPVLRKFGPFQALKPLHRQVMELRFEMLENQLLLNIKSAQLDQLLQRFPEEEMLLTRLDEKFADALMKNPAAATAMKDFLRLNPAPNEAKGQFHTTLPGFAALAPDVKFLLQLADQLTEQARLCGVILVVVQERNELGLNEHPLVVAPAGPHMGSPEYTLMQEAFLAPVRPVVGIPRNVMLRELLQSCEVARRVAADRAFRVNVHEQKHPGAKKELDEWVKAQHTPAEPGDLRYRRLDGFATISLAAKDLGGLRDDSNPSQSDLVEILKMSQNFLLRLLG